MSPAGATIYAVLIDRFNNRWRLQYGGSAVGVQCVMNDRVDTTTANVVRGWIDSNGRLCQENTAGGTWYYNGTKWVSFGPTPTPTPTPTPIPTPTPTPTPQPIGTGPDASGIIRVDFAQPKNYPGRSVQQLVDRRMWGVSTGGAADNCYEAFGNPAFISAAAQINPPLWRVNGNICQRTDSPYFNNDGSINASSWSKLINGFPQVDPAGISGIIIGVNIEGVPGFSDAASYGRVMSNLAQFLSKATMPNGKKFPILGFESQNEPDGMSVARIAPYYNAMWNAVKAVNPALMCCGPVTSWVGNFMPDFLQQVNGLDVYDFHTYQGGYPNLPSPRYSASKGSSDGGWLKQANLGSAKAILVGEYNIDWNCQDPAQQSAEGAVWCARYLLELLNGSPLPLWGAIWDAYCDGTCGVINPSNTVSPNGTMLGKGGMTLFGPRWTVTADSGLLTCATTPSAGHCAMMVVNGGKGAQAGPVGLAHWPVNATGNGTAAVWQMTSTQRTSTLAAVTAGVLQANFPDPSVTFISI